MWEINNFLIVSKATLEHSNCLHIFPHYCKISSAAASCKNSGHFFTISHCILLNSNKWLSVQWPRETSFLAQESVTYERLSHTQTGENKEPTYLPELTEALGFHQGWSLERNQWSGCKHWSAKLGMSLLATNSTWSQDSDHVSFILVTTET